MFIPKLGSPQPIESAPRKGKIEITRTFSDGYSYSVTVKWSEKHKDWIDVASGKIFHEEVTKYYSSQSYVDTWTAIPIFYGNPKSHMVAIVRYYSKQIDNGRTLNDIFGHMVSEQKELKDEIEGKGDGRDGVVGEAIDVIACALDIIFQANPNITDDEIDTIMEKKCAKWANKYS